MRRLVWGEFQMPSEHNLISVETKSELGVFIVGVRELRKWATKVVLFMLRIHPRDYHLGTT